MIITLALTLPARKNVEKMASGDIILGVTDIGVMVTKLRNLEILILSDIFHLINVFCVMNQRLPDIELSEVQNTYQKM